MTTKKVMAGLLVGSLLFGGAVTANAGDDSEQFLVTGAYRCPGDVPGFFHSISFTTTDLGHLNVETEFSNLDTGDCTPRGQSAQNLAKKLGCVTGPLYAFRRGGGAGAAFGFVCKGKRNNMVQVMEKLSEEILRPTQ